MSSSPPIIAATPSRGRALVLLGAAIALGALLLWLTRASVLAWLAESVLDARGLGVANVEVLRLSASHAELGLRGSALGSIANIAVDYGLALSSGLTVKRVRLSGARLQLAWRDGRLFPALGGGTTSSGSAPMQIELLDTRVYLRVGTSLVIADLSGTASSGAQAMAQLAFTLFAPQGRLQGKLAASTSSDGEMQGQLTLEQGELALGTVAAKGLSGQLQLRTAQGELTQCDGKFGVQQLASATQRWGAGTLTIALAAPQATAHRWQLAAQFEPLQLTLRSAPGATPDKHAFALDGTLDARLLAALLPTASVESGHLQVHANGELAATASSLTALLAQGHGQATIEAEARALTLPALAQVATLSAALACQFGQAALSCTTSRDLQLDGLVLAADLAADDSLLAGNMSLRLAAHNDAPLFALTLGADGGDIAVNGAVSLASAQMTLHAPLAARVHFAARQGQSAKDAPTRTASYTVQGALAIERPPHQPWLAPAFNFAGDYVADAISNTLISARLTDGTLDLPAQGWTANALHGRYTPTTRETLKLVIDDLHSTRNPAPLAPLHAELNASMLPRETRFSARLRDASGQLDVGLSGRQLRSGGQGEATLTLQPIALAGAAQLQALSPALAARFSDARGALSGHGEAQWGDGATRSALSLRMQDFALTSPTLKITDLNAALDLDGLAPLHSAAGQHLSATFELPALKTVPFTLRFSVADQRLRIEQARAEVFGGAFATSDGEVDIASGATRIDLKVDDIDLASAFLVLNLEQLKGTGRLSGRLPLRFEGGHIAVEQGLLQANGPGVVQFGAKALTDQLQSYGKDVSLAFDALSDFHYRSMHISADKSLRGAGKALFHLEGDNPAVMAGQPFIFNISLETDFDYLAQLLLDLSGVTNSALGWGAGEIIKQ